MKNTNLLVILSVIGFLLFAGVGTLMVGVSYYNNASSLKEQYDAKLSGNRSEFDAMTKKISKVAQVSKFQLEKLEQIYVKYADARTGEASGELMKWTQEAIPNVDNSTLNNVQNIIVAGHDGFNSKQRELLDVSREYNTLLVKFPSNIVLKTLGFSKIVPTIVTSTRTEDTFKSGKDDDTSVF